MAEQAHRPSERVPTSGVYRVMHNGHRPEHEATMLEGETFPGCTVCGDHVRFTLSRKVASIRDDKDFPRR